MGALMGADVRLAGPKKLHPPKDVVDIANDVAGRAGARVTITDDPRAAVKDVDFVHTDVWVSMGEAKDVWSRPRASCSTKPKTGCIRSRRSSSRRWEADMTVSSPLRRRKWPTRLRVVGTDR
jgi:ornithine carbamoyltransferase